VGTVTYINYAQPIVAAPPLAATTVTSTTLAAAPTPAAPISPTPQSPTPAVVAEPTNRDRALTTFDNARGLFKRGDYAMALAETDRAIALVPDDSLMHEFRALCLFAAGEYKQSAAGVYAVLSTGPGWDWETVSGLYADPQSYTNQLRALETYRDTNPNAAEGRFLLAYHYLLGGHDQAAATELKAVVAIQPNDQLAAQLLKGLTSPSTDQTPPAAPPTPAAPVDPAAVVGNWTASRPDGSKVELQLSADQQFSWKATQQDQTQQMSGKYTLANNYLILTASDQNALVGQVAMESGNNLTFKLAGGNPSDPGLTFTR
jgi:tetratricopeptide (TPR) repeat protein